MKKNFLRISLLLLILILLLSLTACGGKKPSNVDKDKEKENGKVSVGNLLENKGRSWLDDEGLIFVNERGKDLYISYDLDKWEEIYDLSAYLDEHYINIQPGDFELKIVGLDDKVKDIAIGLVENYSGSFADDKEFPAVFFLLENGRVQWLLAMPEPVSKDHGPQGIPNQEYESYSFPAVPWMEDIIELEPGLITEGIGGHTIYAIDKDGLRYDLALPMEFSFLRMNSWIASLEETSSDYDYMILTFDDDENLNFFKASHDAYFDNIDIDGSYRMHLDDSSASGYRAPSISLDIEGYSGSYMIAQENFFHPFHLFLNDGQALDDEDSFYSFYRLEDEY